MKNEVLGYDLTPDVMTALDQAPDLTFIGEDGRNYGVIMRENNTDLRSPRASVFVRAEKDGHVSYQGCGARCINDALMGISLTFRAKVFQLLREDLGRLSTEQP